MSEKLKKINQIKFVSPFARYLAILPLAEKQRHEEQARLDQENKKKKLCPEKTENLEEYVNMRDICILCLNSKLYFFFRYLGGGNKT